MSKTAAALGALLMAVLAAGAIVGIPGCAAASTGPLRASVASVTACTEYGVWAIEHRVTVTRIPAPCQGLSHQDVNQAVAVAVSQAVASKGPARRAIRRRRASEAGHFLADLVTAPPLAPSPAPAGPAWQPSASSQAPVAQSGRDLALDVAALVAWLITAGSGAFVLARWLAQGGRLRLRGGAVPTADTGLPPRLARLTEPNAATASTSVPTLVRTEPDESTASTSVPPPVIVGHAGLGMAGLAFWILYLITGWAALAWTAVLVLLPVAGLGMAVLIVGLPGRDARRAAVPVPDGGSGADQAAGASRTRLAPFLIAGHGVLAACTMLVVLLAALGTAAT
jgi:hypothetical protein